MSSYTLQTDFNQLWQWDITGPDFDDFDHAEQRILQDWSIPFRKEVPRKKSTGLMNASWRDKRDTASTCDEFLRCRSTSTLQHYDQVWLSCLSDGCFSWVVNVCSHHKYTTQCLPLSIAGLPVHIWSDDLLITTKPPSESSSWLEHKLRIDPHQLYDDADIGALLDSFPRAIGLRIMLSGCCEILYATMADTLWATLVSRNASKDLLIRFAGVRHTTLRCHDAKTAKGTATLYSSPADCKHNSFAEACLGFKIRLQEEPGCEYWIASGSSFRNKADKMQSIAANISHKGSGFNVDLGHLHGSVMHASRCSQDMVLIKQNLNSGSHRIVSSLTERMPLQDRFADPARVLKSPLTFVTLSHAACQSLSDKTDANAETVLPTCKETVPTKPDQTRVSELAGKNVRSKIKRSLPDTLVEGVQYLKTQHATSPKFSRHLLWRISYLGQYMFCDNVLSIADSPSKESEAVVFRDCSVEFSCKRWQSTKWGQKRKEYISYKNLWILQSGAILPDQIQSASIICPATPGFKANNASENGERAV
ncbi:hypothetical protein BCR37DRAFT_391469 [Protomyces lactucae-debilis]|uniref:Uncharacterized protein n=1 Tax=Protomyces lactucae-debilis TaxID=2754530 RepID=A0A1Y2FQ30_PROLT|nr:uncharacterized protein BCR37DRAFT_391469 [Protomyces lactucae-debilis]ORY85707.1 hypothetical protein BCR37DRAFT_391469 [Protomyces lactucae-debilis]